MPTKGNPVLVALRGFEEYGEFIDALVAEAEVRGVPGVRSRSDVTALALDMLGKKWGVATTPRCKPLGWQGAKP